MQCGQEARDREHLDAAQPELPDKTQVARQVLVAGDERMGLAEYGRLEGEVIPRIAAEVQRAGGEDLAPAVWSPLRAAMLLRHVL